MSSYLLFLMYLSFRLRPRD